jgi:hypothetical protein
MVITYFPNAFNSLNAELNPICHLLTLLVTHYILHVGRIRVKAPPKSRRQKCDVMKVPYSAPAIVTCEPHWRLALYAWCMLIQFFLCNGNPAIIMHKITGTTTRKCSCPSDQAPEIYAPLPT